VIPFERVLRVIALSMSSPTRYVMVARPAPHPRSPARASRIVRRPFRRSQPLPKTQSAGTPLYRLVGVALLGWIGVMVVAVLLAV
jgi:hypothetical protein